MNSEQISDAKKWNEFENEIEIYILNRRVKAREKVKKVN
jgi:hypothetical protein